MLSRQPSLRERVVDAVFPPATKDSDVNLVRVFTILLCVVYVLVAALIGFAIWELVFSKAERHFIAWTVSGLCVCIAIPLPLNDILMHSLHYVRRSLQKYYIRILLFVPIFSLSSWLCLRFYTNNYYFNVVRELYEAFVLWSFFNLMIEYFKDRQELVRILEAKEHRYAHMLFPFCWFRPTCRFPLFRPWLLGEQFVMRTSFGVLQYVLVRIVLAISQFVVTVVAPERIGTSDFGDFTKAYVYVVAIFNISQIWAMYCLILFYHELAKDMAPIKPLAKFLCIKAIVFLTFWQGIIIGGMEYIGMIPHSVEWDTQQVGEGLQNFMICIEMALFAVAHRFFFSYKDFEGDLRIAREEGVRTPGAHKALLDIILMPSDIAKDTRTHATANIRRIVVATNKSSKQDVIVTNNPLQTDGGIALIAQFPNAALSSEVLVATESPKPTSQRLAPQQPPSSRVVYVPMQATTIAETDVPVTTDRVAVST